MPLCPPPSRKHSAFPAARLAQGLHSNRAMRGASFFAAILIASLSTTARAQQADRINRIDGFVLEATEDAWFNAEQCADPSSTTYELRITTGAGVAVTQVYLWAGREQGNCQEFENRMTTSESCREMAGNPRTVEPDNLISGLTLQELLDTGVVTCDTSGLQGTPYEIFAFRNSDPGSTDVPGTDYGIAPIIVDVAPPAELSITNNLTQVGQSFGISWTRPTDNIWIYRFYESDVDDPETARLIQNITAGQNETSQTIRASDLGMEVGDTKYIFVAAQDRAFIESSGANGGNLGPLSVGTQVNAITTTGFCEATGDCTGCSVSPLSLRDPATASTILWMGLALAVILARRRRR